MARTPTRIAGPELVQDAATTVYTCPADTIAVVRHIHISNPTGSPVTFTLSIGASAAGTRLFDGYSIPANSVFPHHCYHVLNETEVIQASAGADEDLVLTIGGDEYPAP